MPARLRMAGRARAARRHGHALGEAHVRERPGRARRPPVGRLASVGLSMHDGMHGGKRNAAFGLGGAPGD
jgi:hypothetical protein